jgi:hypothetical protein
VGGCEEGKVMPTLARLHREAVVASRALDGAVEGAVRALGLVSRDVRFTRYLGAGEIHAALRGEDASSRELLCGATVDLWTPHLQVTCGACVRWLEAELAKAARGEEG